MSEAVSQDAATASNDQNTMSFTFSSGEKTEEDPAAKFRGPGTSFRAKLIGSEEVSESRGDKMCQESILKLKALVKASGQHKQKIVINVTLDGIKLIDLMTAQVIQQHSVNKISFIARDQTDRRAFGYVYGLGDGKHLFFGIKTAKVAENVVLSLRDLFNIVYDMKKKEIEAAKKTSEVNGTESTAVQPPVNNMPVHTSQPQQQEGNIFALEQQLENMQEMSNMDAFKSEWNENIPTSPDTPASPETMNLFGTNVDGGATQQNSQYSNDLAGFDMEALEPAADGGAKLTKNQILAGFSQGPAGGMQQPMPQASQFFGGQQQQAQPFGGSQQSGFGGQPGFGAPQQPGFGASQQPGFGATQQPGFGATQQPGFGATQQPAFGAPNPFGGSQSMGMFSPGQRPAVPVRTGAMRPPVPNQAQAGASQNPFGDAFGGASSGSDTLLAPSNSQSNAANGSNNTTKGADPFASLIPGMGVASTDKKDMFKNFQMAKPSEKSTTNAVSSNFDDYFMKSVGGVPLDTETLSAPTPTPAPRTMPQDFANSNPTPQATQNDDPFAAFGSGFGGNSQQATNNTQSLFG